MLEILSYPSHISNERNKNMNLIWFLIIGAVAGWLAGKIMKGGGFGLLGNLLVGIIGAFVGGFLFSLLGIYTSNMLGSLVTAVVGAVVLIFVVDKIRR